MRARRLDPLTCLLLRRRRVSAVRGKVGASPDVALVSTADPVCGASTSTRPAIAQPGRKREAVGRCEPNDVAWLPPRRPAARQVSKRGERRHKLAVAAAHQAGVRFCRNGSLSLAPGRCNHHVHGDVVRLCGPPNPSNRSCLTTLDPVLEDRRESLEKTDAACLRGRRSPPAPLRPEEVPREGLRPHVRRPSLSGSSRRPSRTWRH
jgi:hypothetical protein